ncbi:ExbD/TolR family protein [Planctellipticum variicoloris]|uniref:ExbD/TolR family protein n=1 Tax=Planctellipticum variicoloris TaxID=3064265 RepID=UPI0030139645|nr:biopolymer transporter ExbD [Planctomycetaceae bacterium SH412]
MPKTRQVTITFEEPDMTPMIDIVFQLLTFFMVAINFENTQADERVKLPKDMLAKPPEVRPDDELVLNMGYEKLGRQGQPVVFYTGEEIPVSKMLPRLQQEARIFRQTKVDPKAVTVVIRSSADVPTGEVQELIKSCQAAEFEKFALKATQEEK